MNEPVWLKQARKYVGLKEVPGKGNNKTIVGFWAKIKQKFNNDEVPWCAGFVGAVLEEVGITSTRSAAARSYQTWGYKLNGPAVGAIVVFWRGSPKGYQGHVAIVAGKDHNGNIMCLGGNQGDMVCVKPFGRGRVVTYRWPSRDGVQYGSPNYDLPFVASEYGVSTNEA